MIANINERTGIKYGVASQETIDPDVLNDLWLKALDKTYEAVYQEQVEQFKKEGLDEGEAEEKAQEELEHRSVDMEPDGQPFEYEGVTVAVSTLGGAPLVFIMESPVVVKARLCSPCVPNAGNLDDLDPENGHECYGIPDDWKPVSRSTS